MRHTPKRICQPQAPDEGDNEMNQRTMICAGRRRVTTGQRGKSESKDCEAFNKRPEREQDGRDLQKNNEVSQGVSQFFSVELLLLDTIHFLIPES